MRRDFGDFEKNVLDLYADLAAALEAADEDRNLSRAEVLCVLGNMACAAARDSGLSRETFIATMELAYMNQPLDSWEIH
jgi:hypothetical protein|tara:strand:+ start:179 stop:415 length:237 start_codon:yes stop_codon:yes gene_type:complete